MLKIAVVGNTYQETIIFAEYKFKDKIESRKLSYSMLILKNGDEIHLCYDEINRDTYKSMEYDAFVVVPTYKSLLDCIRANCIRARCEK